MSEFKIRRSSENDLAQILQLYSKSYQGTYPDATFTSVNALIKAYQNQEKFIYVCCFKDKVVGCLLFMYDKENKIAKAGAAVVSPLHRGNNLTQKLLKYGIENIQSIGSGLDILYITTRTVHKAAQVLTQNMGFAQLGIFPNVHKTEDYETHALAAMFFNDTLSERYTDFEQHPKIQPLFNIVRENTSLPEMKKAEIWNRKNYTGQVPILEMIDAPAFVKNRKDELVARGEVDLGFFPFHTPTVLITSPNRSIEVFAYVNEADKHCVVTGCVIDREVSFTDLFLKLSSLLRDRGIRYIEIIIRANRLNIVDKILNARFIPCGYVPAFQLEHGERYDYIVFSRSFEILDFKNLELMGANEKYLRNYVSLWEDIFLGKEFAQKGIQSEGPDGE